MNSKNNIETDNIFREKLGNYASELPENFWDQLQQERKSRQKTGFPYRYLLLLLLLLISVTAYYNIVYHTSDERNDSTFRNSLKEDQQAQNGLIPNENQASYSIIADPQDQKFNLSSKNNSERITGTTQIADHTYVRSGDTAISILRGTNTEKNVFVSENIDSDQANSIGVRQKDAVSAQIDNDRYDSIDKDTKGTGIEHTDDFAGRISRENMNLSHGTGTTSTETDRINTVSALSVALKSVISQNKEEISGNKLPSLKNTCPDFLIKRYKTYLEFVFAPEFAMRKLSASQPGYRDYVDLRDQTEVNNYAFHTGTRISIVYKSGIALKTGLIYSQIAERFYYSREESITEQKWEVIEEIPSQTDPGRVYQVWDSVEYIYSGHRLAKYYNRHHSIDVPLMIGYEKRFHGFSLSAYLGANLNLWFASKSSFFSPESEPVNYTTDNLHDRVERLTRQAGLRPLNRGEFFKNTVGINLIATMACNYRLSHRSYLVFEPEFRMYLNSFTKHDSGIRQHYIIPGVVFGLRYEIN